MPDEVDKETEAGLVNENIEEVKQTWEKMLGTLHLFEVFTTFSTFCSENAQEMERPCLPSPHSGQGFLECKESSITGGLPLPAVRSFAVDSGPVLTASQ